MKKYVAIAIVVAVALSIMYEIEEETKAIRNIKIEINDATIENIGVRYITIGINVSIINGESRDIKNMKGNFEIYILNVSFGSAKLDEASIKSHSSFTTRIPLKIYYHNLTEGILNAIKEGNFDIKMKGKITGKIFFGLLEYSQNVEARWH